jgi:hypothetical protein
LTDLFTDLMGKIYMATDADGAPALGWLCWAPVAYAPKAISVVRAKSNDPASPDYKRYWIETVPLGDVGKGTSRPLGQRFPDKNLSLSEGEDLFVVRGKIRPVLVFLNPTAKLNEAVHDQALPAKELDNCLGCLARTRS